MIFAGNCLGLTRSVLLRAACVLLLCIAFRPTVQGGVIAKVLVLPRDHRAYTLSARDDGAPAGVFACGLAVSSRRIMAAPQV